MENKEIEIIYERNIRNTINNIKFYYIRQNYFEKTLQNNIRNFILENNFVCCPFACFGINKINVINKIYNNKTKDESGRTSKNQDKKFVEDIKIGDIIVIPFRNKKENIIARIISEIIYNFETEYFISIDNNKVKLDKKNGERFNPIGRRIEILHENFIFRDKRKVLGIQTLREIKNIEEIIHLI